MLKTIAKNSSLIAIIAVILIASIGGYYILNLKQGRYKASSFNYLIFKWGVGDTLANSYNSKTKQYQYLDRKDALVKKKLTLHTNEVIFLHSKLSEYDFWTLPKVIANKNTDLKDPKVLRFEITVSYDTQTKKVIYLTNYDDDQAVAGRIDALQKIIAQTVSESEERYSN